jgi:hypothetical protein
MLLHRLILIVRKTAIEIIGIFCQIVLSKDYFEKGICSMGSIASITVILILVYSAYKTIQSEIISEIKDIFNSIQRTVNAGKFTTIGNIPSDITEYEETKKRVFSKMKEHKIVRIWFNDDKLIKFISDQYENIFKITKSYPQKIK